MYGNDKNKVFFSTVIDWERLISNLSTNVLKQLSINDREYQLFKKYLFQKTEFFMKLIPIRANFETTINESRKRTTFVYCRQKTFKIRVHTTKSRLPINSPYKFSFFSRYFYIKNEMITFQFFFCCCCLKEKIHVSMTSFKIITKFRKVFSRF